MDQTHEFNVHLALAALDDAEACYRAGDKVGACQALQEYRTYRSELTSFD